MNLDIRERMARAVGGRAYKVRTAVVQDLARLVDQRWWMLGDDQEFMEAIQQNPASLNHRRDILLTGTANVTEAERLEAVAESRRLYRRTPIGGRLVGLWTDFGFGQNIEIEPRGEEAQAVWEEFWTARRNLPVLKARDIHRLSDQVLTDGELFFIMFADEESGQTTIRTRPTEEWREFVTDPDDDAVVLFYKREWESDNGKQNEVYYRDWMFVEEDAGKTSLGDAEGLPDNYPDNEQQAGNQIEGSDVTVLHAAREADDNKRGWPMLYRGARWIRAYRKLAQDLLSVTERNALYGAHIRTKGGSRAVDVLKNTLQSAMTSLTNDYETNPPPPAGSDLVTNEAVELRESPLNKAASEGNNVTSMILGSAGLAGGVFQHYLGRGEAYRLATATSMETPIKRQFARYQGWWADVFREMCHAVLWNAQEHGGVVYYQDVFDSKGNVVGQEEVDALAVEVDVSTDALIEQDVNEFAEALERLAPYVPDPETLTRLALQALNVPNIQDVLNTIYPDDEGAEETRISKVDLGVIEATLRILAEDGLEGEHAVMTLQALSIAEGSNGRSDNKLAYAGSEGRAEVISQARDA